MSEIPDAWHVAQNQYRQPHEPRPYGASADWQPEKRFDHRPPEITSKQPYPEIDRSKLLDWMKPKTPAEKAAEIAAWHAEAARQIEELYGKASPYDSAWLKRVSTSFAEVTAAAAAEAAASRETTATDAWHQHHDSAWAGEMAAGFAQATAAAAQHAAVISDADLQTIADKLAEMTESNRKTAALINEALAKPSTSE